MKSCIIVGLCILGLVMPCRSENPDAPVLRGLSVYGSQREDEPPVIVRDSIDSEGKGVGGGYITIQFDLLSPDPPNFKIRFFHCDRDWHPDENMFVQRENHNVSFALEYRTAPGGVRNYSYRYINRFPDARDVVRFEYSGNWIFRILDPSESTVLGEGRFFVVDRITPTAVKVTNEYLTANVSPLNQAHRLDVRINLRDEIDGMYYTAADVYQNRRFYNPRRIDANDRDPYTFVDGLGRGYRIFSVNDILPGNEYRTLDLSNVTRYPNGTLVRSVEGADQERQFWRTGPDHNGTAMMNRFSGINSDYLEVLFRLDLLESERQRATSGGRGIFVVGPFNQWNPGVEDQLSYDPAEQSMTVKKLLRRGVYDYQYITGVWSESTGRVEEQDWQALEGNDWRTIDRYFAFVYYRDPRFGGFDRIAGYGQAVSSPAR